MVIILVSSPFGNFLFGLLRSAWDSNNFYHAGLIFPGQRLLISDTGFLSDGGV